MRLDHLLSKEHWPHPSLDVVQSRAQAMTVIQSRMAARVWGGARGWNTDQFGRPASRAPSTACPRVCVDRSPDVGYRFVGTLLGPERAGNRFFSVRAFLFSYRHLSAEGVGRRGWLGSDWSYVENCTVDASIF